jgi:CBS domain-containing protein
VGYQPGVIRRERGVARVSKTVPVVDKPPPHPADGEASPGSPPGVIAYAGGAAARTNREAAVVAEQIMTAPVVTLPPEATLDDAWKLVVQRGLRHIPIVDAGGKLAGIISDRDLLRHRSDQSDGKDAPSTTTLSEHAAAPVLSASPNTAIRDIARVMFEERVGSMPIVNEAQILVGILTRSDILRTVVNRAPISLWV